MSKISWLLLTLFLLLAPSLLAQAYDEKPSLRLLVVGVGRFADSRIPPLEYPDDDAMGLEFWSQTQPGRMYDKVDSIVLLNEEATRGEIVNALIKLFTVSGPQDQVLVFLGGHGVLEERTGDYYFLSHDTLVDNIAGTALESNEILKAMKLSRLPPAHVLILVDTCHSAKLAEALRSVEEDTTRGYQTGDIEGPIWVPIVDLGGQDSSTAAGSDDGKAAKESLRRPGEKAEDGRVEVPRITTISAGNARGAAREGKQYRLPGEGEAIEGHGLLMAATLEALADPMADRNQDGGIGVAELYAAVEKRVREESEGTQIPRIFGSRESPPISALRDASEICDGKDNNLNGQVDEGFPDTNQNGRADCLEPELCNGLDDDGDGEVDEGFDLDQDGYRSIKLCGQAHGKDCDDADPSRHPDQMDWGNLRDDDCDGQIDENDSDRNGNGIPDLMEARAQKLSKTRWAALGAGVAFGVATLAAYSQLFALMPSASSSEAESEDAFRVDDKRRESYLAWSRATAALAVPAVVGIGVSFHFTGRHIRFKRGYFPDDSTP